jgi:putative membrane protein insertion efficiency factor
MFLLKILMKLWSFMKLILSYLLKGLIIIYKYTLSPLLGPKCRYLPTCSSYGMEAIERYGPFLGGWLTLKRIGRCNPWGGQGFDPVPKDLYGSKKLHGDESTEEEGMDNNCGCASDEKPSDKTD